VFITRFALGLSVCREENGCDKLLAEHSKQIQKSHGSVLKNVITCLVSYHLGQCIQML
jgi:hypothetical protein